MRRLREILIAAAIIALAAPARGDVGVGFRLNGGYAYVGYADFNDFADQMNERELPSLGVGAELDNIHWIPQFTAELLVSPASGVTIGAGAGIISGSAEFSFSLGSEGISYRHTMKAYPVGVTGYYAVPLHAAPIRPYLYGGLAAVYSKITFDETLTAGGTSDGLDAGLSTWGFELHGGAGIGFPIFANVSIDLAVAGRWAKLTGYEGSATFIGGTRSDVFLAKETTDLSTFYGPELKENRDEYEEASVDLSGVAVTVGFTVTF